MMRTTVLGLLAEALGLAATFVFAWMVWGLPVSASCRLGMLGCQLLMAAGLLAFVARKLG